MTMREPFADRCAARCAKVKSCLVPGFDPVLENIPQVFQVAAQKQSSSTSDFVTTLLVQFYEAALDALADRIPAIKPNIAFFEQYGIPGLLALQKIAQSAQRRGVLVVLDAKRGDIGSTAEAYARAYLTGAPIRGEDLSLVRADALTVSPFMGFDTIAPFLKEAASAGAGLFVLCKTSNPGSKEFMRDGVSERIAAYLTTEGAPLSGQRSGLTGLGAVIGATYPEELQALRAHAPKSWFLIPGVGAQGGKAADLKSALVPTRDFGQSGLLVVAARGLFAMKAPEMETVLAFQEQLRKNAIALVRGLAE